MAKELITQEQNEQLVAAIKTAELRTSGEIRVHIQAEVKGDVFEVARQRFEEMGMTETELRNGVLVFVATKSRKVAILGDRGINDVVPEGFWDDAVKLMIDRFKQDDLVGGIEAAVLKVGEILRQYFPYTEDDVNELDDSISLGD